MSYTAIKTEHGEGIFETPDKLCLFEQWWQPAREAKAVVIIVHGFAEHSSRYNHVAAHLTDHGYSVYTFDQRGHGRSEGARAFIKSFEDHVRDLELFLSRVREREAGRPIFILGHSMGGAVTALFAASRKPDISGLVLSGALVKISDDIPKLLVRCSVLMGRLLPKLRTIKLDSKAVSRNPEVVRQYDTDSLVYRGGIPARSGAELFLATNLIQSQMESITLPLLILHGTADRLSNAEGSRLLHSKVSSTDKTLKLYEGFYHEILNEPEKSQVLADIVQWLEIHL
jgi:acylglycerol lipase